MQLFKKTTTFDFLGARRLALIFSISLILIAIGSFVTRGLNFGIDFTGGTLVEVGYGEPAELAKIRDALAADGFKDAVVQHFGTSRDVLVRLAPREDVESAVLSDRAFNAMRKLRMERNPQSSISLRDHCISRGSCRFRNQMPSIEPRLLRRCRLLVSNVRIAMLTSPKSILTGQGVTHLWQMVQ